MLSQLDRAPEVGDTAEAAGYEFEVTSVEAPVSRRFGFERTTATTRRRLRSTVRTVGRVGDSHTVCCRLSDVAIPDGEYPVAVTATSLRRTRLSRRIRAGKRLQAGRGPSREHLQPGQAFSGVDAVRPDGQL